MRQETRKALNRTADLAARALHFLIADGKLGIRDVTTALSRRKKLIKELKDRFTALETGAVASTAKARKATPHKAAKSESPKAAARARAGARSAGKVAGEARKKTTVARSARRKASTRKAAVSSKPTPRPGRVKAGTRKRTQIAVTAEAAKQKPRPGAEAESGIPTPALAPKPEGRKLPKVANPEHGGTGPGARDWSQT